MVGFMFWLHGTSRRQGTQEHVGGYPLVISATSHPPHASAGGAACHTLFLQRVLHTPRGRVPRSSLCTPWQEMCFQERHSLSRGVWVYVCGGVGGVGMEGGRGGRVNVP